MKRDSALQPNNPAREVADIYREELTRHLDDFDVVAFAIYNPGYGPNNFAWFEEEFRGFAMSDKD